ncbi:DUF3858 domain-containing protein [Pedobacter sp. MR2016-24]|uniref:transglutaminase domain-containing protein n=1 Tax=Pedobacter sp. MR2016-24 TaxID=2994466 RepID=UPI002246FEF0|nr:DUF3858 domain-containing protein [Pedobacter sp. MR2016-24]MCX2486512.1 DUF3858 domain-containing protein [Pedobacter sp. MR2016-24]
MIKTLNLILLLLFATVVNISAQNKKTILPVFKYGKIEQSDFDAKGSGQDSAAAAIKLFDVGEGSFEVGPGGSFMYVFERHVRYKVINKNGYDLANLSIPLYFNNNGQEKLDFINGATYNLNAGKIEVSKMTSDAKFSSKYDKNHILKKFTLPNIKEGSVIEYRYKTKSDFIFKLEDWYFQGEYPCRFSSLKTKFPQYYTYKINAGGYIPILKLDPVENTENFHIPSSNSDHGGNVSARVLTTQYYAENIPSIKEESYITTLDDYVSKIGFELNSTNFPSEGYKEYTSTWPKIISKLVDDENFGGFIKKKNYSKELVNGIINQETDTEKKMKLIFDYVKSNIKWDDKYNKYTEAVSPKAVLDKKAGNSAEINLLLLNLLKSAGIEVSPVLISTRNNGAHPGYPLITQFNNVIVMAEIGDQKHFLDATDKNNVTDMISYQNLNHQGLKVNIDNNQTEWISTENTSLSRTSISYSLKLNADNQFEGKAYLSSTNYAGLRKRNTYQAAATEDEFIKNYKSSKPGLEISNYKIANLDLPDQPLEESMDITIEDNIEDAGNLSYFMPLLFERTKENPFNLEERNFPVDFAYPIEENFRLSVELPAGCQLEKLPKSEKFVLPDNGGSFTILFNSEGNTLGIMSKINILKSTFTADEYYNLKELFKNIVRKQSEQIVFKKI